MQHEIRIRRARSNDEEVVADLAVTNKMFAVDEVGGLIDAFRSAVVAGSDGHEWFVATARDDEVIAAAYVAPEPFADRLWNLYFIAVDPTQHGAGVGTGLLEHVEEWLRAKGEEEARVLLIETSSTPQYDATRAFYAVRGFTREAQIREFYGPGDHKVVFWKTLVE